MKQIKKGWGFDTRDMDTSVRPQDDFFRHVHGNWLKRTKIPENESRWGSFVTLRVDTEKKLKKMVDALMKGRYAAGSPEQMIRDFYKSGIDEAKREKLGTKPLAPWMAKIDALKSPKDFTAFFAEFEEKGLGGIWGLLLDQDYKNSERYLVNVYQGGLSMPERDYYLKDDAESLRVRTAYVKHIEAIHCLLGYSAKEATDARETIMRIEHALAQASMTKEDARDSEKIYHKLSFAQLERIAPAIEWTKYFKAIGMAAEKDVMVMQPDFLKAVSKMLVDTPLEDWKVYLRFHLANGAAGALSKKFVKENFAFYGTILSGSKKMKPIWRRALGATNGALGELLGQTYVKLYFTSLAKKRMNLLVDDLFTAYAVRIKNIDWMTPATKKKALAKLAMVTRKIGYPDKWKSYTGLEVRTDDYFGNLLRSAAYEHRREARKLGRPIDRTVWGMSPQTVNAYCNFGMNEIVFPAAILQPPFFDMYADDALNYGAIGSVIGHEITHAFDDQGSKFDGKGNMKSWWTDADRKSFDKKAKLVKEQFDQYRVADGVPVNGQLTLGENIADLGGASIAYDAYQLHLARLDKSDLSRLPIEGFTSEQRFFLGFALFERELTRPEFVKMQVLTDPHSPGEFRINGPASNLPEFYAAWGVKKGDKLYREPKDRAKIW
jgi:predicted metalloendopeptidase